MSLAAEDAVRVRDGVATIALRGEVDIVTVPPVRDSALRALQPPLREVRVELAECTFLDSAGIAALAALWSRARELDAAFALLHPQTNVRVVLAIAGLSDLVVDDAADPTPREARS
jgi:anti-anti-sigma factor